MTTSRRGFLGSIGVGIFGIFGSKYELLKGNTLEATNDSSLPSKSHGILPGSGKGGNPRDVKINVKLIFYAMIHSGSWQGPCRYRGGGGGPEEESIQARNQFDERIKNFRSSLTQDARILEPVYFEFPEFVQIKRKDLMRLEADKEEVDLYFITGFQMSTHIETYFASVLAKIYKKPIVASSSGGRNTTSYLKSIGVESYVTANYGGLNKLISLLRAKKAFQQTNMLLITDLGGTVGGPGYLRGSVRDFKDLKNRFGIGTTIISFKELSDERDRIIKNKNSMAEVENLTDKLIRKAQKVHIGKDQLIGDVLVHHTVKNLMKKYYCNAFSIECFEWCASRQPDMWKAIPCLTHSLLRDEGYPSSCEGDICALLTLDVFMGLAKNSAYMGNMNPTVKNRKRSNVTEQWVKGVDSEGDKLWVGHNVPGLKMLGFDKPDLSYELRNFIRADDDAPGWGVSIKIDFTKIKEKTVTIGRFNPLTTKMLVTKGEVVGMRGFDNQECSTGIIINVQDPKGFENKSSDYGHHFALAYGDYTQELIHLADMLKIEVELHGDNIAF